MSLFRNKPAPLRVAVIGAGYVGLVSAYDYVRRSHSVMVIDIDVNKIKDLREGKIPFHEPNLSFKPNSLKFEVAYTALRDFDPQIVVFCVGTPPNEIDGSSDLSMLRKAISDAAIILGQDVLFIIKSTVPCGTSDEMRASLRTAMLPQEKFVSNPEFLREGHAVEDVRNPDRIVLGLSEFITADDRKLLGRLYDNSPKIIWTDVRSAEMAKYASNAFLALKVTYANEIGDLAKTLGANIDDITKIMGKDDRIGPKFLQVGPGFGGSCFPKDVRALIRTAKDNHVPLSIVETLQDANEERKIRIAKELIQFFDVPRTRPSLLVYGVAFKEGTDDVRGSSAATILPLLQQAGVSLMHIFEHHPKFAETVFPYPFVDVAASPLRSILGGYDGLILMNRPKPGELNANDIRSLSGTFKVADLRNVLPLSDPTIQDMCRNGFYYSLGR